MNKITGTISKVNAPESIPYGEGKTFDKQTFRIEIEGKRSVNVLEFEMTGDAIGKISTADEGRKAEISYFINGREGKGKHEGRVFMSLRYAEHSFIDGGAADELPGTEDDSEELGF